VASIGIALGLGAQDLVRNVIGGIVVLADRPFQLGDRVRVGDAYGEIDHIGLRSTKLTTPDDTRGTRVPLLWLWHDRDEARDVETPVSTRDLYGALLQAAGDPDASLFSITDAPDRSTTIMQSYWYNNRGRTRA
jgi:hypothetical protein